MDLIFRKEWFESTGDAIKLNCEDEIVLFEGQNKAVGSEGRCIANTGLEVMKVQSAVKFANAESLDH